MGLQTDASYFSHRPFVVDKTLYINFDLDSVSSLYKPLGIMSILFLYMIQKNYLKMHKTTKRRKNIFRNIDFFVFFNDL